MIVAPPSATHGAGHRLVLSRARIRAQLARPPAQALESWLEGGDPTALAWHWACTEADRRLGDPVRAHPGTALGVAFGVGVLVAAVRPWRWRSLPGARLLSPLVLAALTQWAFPREPR